MKTPMPKIRAAAFGVLLLISIVVAATICGNGLPLLVHAAPQASSHFQHHSNIVFVQPVLSHAPPEPSTPTIVHGETRAIFNSTAVSRAVRAVCDSPFVQTKFPTNFAQPAGPESPRQSIVLESVETLRAPTDADSGTVQAIRLVRRLSYMRW